MSKLDNNEVIIIFKVIDLIKYFFSCVTAIIIAYLVYLSLGEIAGKTTIASFLVEYLTSSNSHSGIPWFTTGVATIWAFLERRLRTKGGRSKSKIQEILASNLPNGDTTTDS